MTQPLEYRLSGEPGPTVVLINGAGGPMEGWYRILPDLEREFAVFRYNRPGLGKSAPATEPQTAAMMVAALHKTLIEAGAVEPYLLVGHSFGGFIADLFARTFPQKVRGVVFLEASTSADVEDNRRSGKLRLRGSFSETDQVLETVAQLQNAPPFPPLPIVVVVGTRKPLLFRLRKVTMERRWANERGLLALSDRSSLREATRSGHFPQFSEPGLVIAAIKSLG